jgi:hypothetical protein
MLSVLETNRIIRLRDNGHLLPWLGPALRGLSSKVFKTKVCRHPLPLLDTTWRYCKGCPHLYECPYGLTVEGEPAADRPRFRGQEDGMRPMVISPEFPLPREGKKGFEFRLTVLFIGPSATSQADAWWTSFVEVGRDPALGLEPSRTTFDVFPSHDNQDHAKEWDVNLPLHPEASSEIIPNVTVELTTPLMLRAEDERGHHQLVESPTFADLFRAGLRLIGGLCTGYGEPLEADFTSLKDAALKVPTVRACYRRFTQAKSSTRSGQKAKIRATLGHATFANVPQPLLPWLKLAGKLHIGPHRIAGAGSWRVHC